VYLTKFSAKMRKYFQRVVFWCRKRGALGARA